MNAPATFTAKHRWNHASAVTSCALCEGTGKVHAHRRATVDDPYPEQDCECGQGEHEPCCAVCGFTLEVDGYDCLVCETVDSLGPKALRRLDADEFAAAVRVAQEKALRAQAVAA